ncbi:MAG: hypothetical protein JWO41_588 [Candidatus Saccharibacteria bacterium]|nr:hypothetical protein [Candidatus Saccharibacteria bacterium]
MVRQRFSGMMLAGALGLGAGCSQGASHEAAPTPSVSATISPEQEVDLLVADFKNNLAAGKKAKMTVFIGACSLVAAEKGYYVIPNLGFLSSEDGNVNVEIAYDTLKKGFFQGVAAVSEAQKDGSYHARPLPGSPDELGIVLSPEARMPQLVEVSLDQKHGLLLDDGREVSNIASYATLNPGESLRHAADTNTITQKLCDTSVHPLSFPQGISS